MKLILGGAYQGKLTWAVEQFGLAPDTLCDLAQGFQPGKRCYYTDVFRPNHNINSSAAQKA